MTQKASPLGVQGKIQQMALAAPGGQDVSQLQTMIRNSSVVRDLADRQSAIQRAAKQPDGADSSAVQPKSKNDTGMPDSLKSGIENLSGHDMSDVRVHYNSDKPAQLNAKAFAQGSDIHLGSGQEQHLPHEAWHVVQQKEGRVKPTTSVDGAPLNDDVSLEKEADVKGSQAAQLSAAPEPPPAAAGTSTASNPPIQLISADDLRQSVPGLGRNASIAFAGLGWSDPDTITLAQHFHTAPPHNVYGDWQALAGAPALLNQPDMVRDLLTTCTWGVGRMTALLGLGWTPANLLALAQRFNANDGGNGVAHWETVASVAQAINHLNDTAQFARLGWNPDPAKWLLAAFRANPGEAAYTSFRWNVIASVAGAVDNIAETSVFARLPGWTQNNARDLFIQFYVANPNDRDHWNTIADCDEARDQVNTTARIAKLVGWTSDHAKDLLIAFRTEDGGRNLDHWCAIASSPIGQDQLYDVPAFSRLAGWDAAQVVTLLGAFNPPGGAAKQTRWTTIAAAGEAVDHPADVAAFAGLGDWSAEQARDLLVAYLNSEGDPDRDRWIEIADCAGAAGAVAAVGKFAALEDWENNAAKQLLIAFNATEDNDLEHWFNVASAEGASARVDETVEFAKISDWDSAAAKSLLEEYLSATGDDESAHWIALAKAQGATDKVSDVKDFATLNGWDDTEESKKLLEKCLASGRDKAFWLEVAAAAGAANKADTTKRFVDLEDWTDAGETKKLLAHFLSHEEADISYWLAVGKADNACNSADDVDAFASLPWTDSRETKKLINAFKDAGESADRDRWTVLASLNEAKNKADETIDFAKLNGWDDTEATKELFKGFLASDRSRAHWLTVAKAEGAANKAETTKIFAELNGWQNKTESTKKLLKAFLSASHQTDRDHWTTVASAVGAANKVDDVIAFADMKDWSDKDEAKKLLTAFLDVSKNDRDRAHWETVAKTVGAANKANTTAAFAQMKLWGAEKTKELLVKFFTHAAANSAHWTTIAQASGAKDKVEDVEAFATLAGWTNATKTKNLVAAFFDASNTRDRAYWIEFATAAGAANKYEETIAFVKLPAEWNDKTQAKLLFTNFLKATNTRKDHEYWIEVASAADAVNKAEDVSGFAQLPAAWTNKAKAKNLIIEFYKATNTRDRDHWLEVAKAPNAGNKDSDTAAFASIKVWTNLKAKKLLDEYCDVDGGQSRNDWIKIANELVDEPEPVAKLMRPFAGAVKFTEVELKELIKPLKQDGNNGEKIHAIIKKLTDDGQGKAEVKGTITALRGNLVHGGGAGNATVPITTVEGEQRLSGTMIHEQVVTSGLDASKVKTHYPDGTAIPDGAADTEIDDLWDHCKNEDLFGESADQIQVRRRLALHQLMTKWTAQKKRIQQIYNHDSGKTARAFVSVATEDGYAPKAGIVAPHTVSKHVLGQPGLVQTHHDVARRAAFNDPTPGSSAASAFGSLANANTAVAAAFASASWDWLEARRRLTKGINLDKVYGPAPAPLEVRYLKRDTPRYPPYPAPVAPVNHAAVNWTQPGTGRDLIGPNPPGGGTPSLTYLDNANIDRVRVAVVPSDSNAAHGWQVLTAFPDKS